MKNNSTCEKITLTYCLGYDMLNESDHIKLNESRKQDVCQIYETTCSAELNK